MNLCFAGLRLQLSGEHMANTCEVPGPPQHQNLQRDRILCYWIFSWKIHLDLGPHCNALLVALPLLPHLLSSLSGDP